MYTAGSSKPVAQRPAAVPPIPGSGLQIFSLSRRSSQVSFLRHKEGVRAVQGTSNLTILCQLQTAGVIQGFTEITTNKLSGIMQHARGVTMLQGSTMFLLKQLPHAIADFKQHRNIITKGYLTPDERVQLQQHLSSLLQAELGRLLTSAAEKRPKLQQKHEKVLARAQLHRTRAQTSRLNEISAELDDCQEQTVREAFGHAQVDKIRRLPVPEGGSYFPSLVFEIGRDKIFICPPELDLVVDKNDITPEEIHDAAAQVDLFSCSPERYYAATVTQSMHRNMTVLSDAVVSNRIAVGCLVRPLGTKLSPAVLACYQALVLDPGSRVFKRGPDGRFKYVQEQAQPPPLVAPVPAAAAAAAASDDSESSEQYMAEAGSNSPMSPEYSSSHPQVTSSGASSTEKGAEGDEEGADPDSGIQLDVSRILHLAEQAADVVLVGLFDTRQPYWVHQMGLKILQQQFKQKVAVEVAAGLALAFDDESDAGYSPDATVVDQCWCAGCTAVALGLEACGHQEAHDKMMTDPITCDYPGYGGYASAREQLLEMGQQADNNQVQALACKLGDWDQLRTDVTGKLAGLRLGLPVAPAAPLRRDAPPPRQLFVGQGDADALDAVKSGSAPNTPATAAAPVAAAAPTTVARDQGSGKGMMRAAAPAAGSPTTSASTPDKQQLFKKAVEQLVQAATHNSNAGPDAMREAAQEAKLQLQKQQRYGQHLLPVSDSPLEQQAEKQISMMDNEAFDIMVNDVRLLEVILPHLKELYS